MNYIIYLFIVALPITLASLLFPVGDKAGKGVLQRPPSYMFGIVWPILYILIARAWYLLEKESLSHYVYSLLVGMLTLWLICYYYDKRYGLWCLVMGTTLAMGVMSWSMTVSREAGFTVLPLVGWMLFATMLNFREIDIN